MDICLIIYFVLLGASIVYTFLAVRKQKERIRALFEERGAREISVNWQLWNWDRRYLAYEITYLDAEGKSRYASCKIHILGDSTINWENHA